MTDQPSREPAPGKPQRQPYGPGILMVLGLFLLLVAAWCGYDLATKDEWQAEGKTGTIVFNWVGMIGFGIAAVYTFVLAAKRSKSGVGVAAPADEAVPEEADKGTGEEADEP